MPITFVKKPAAPVLSPERLFNPMLAAEGVLGEIDYGRDGMYALPKHNGVRGMVQEATLLSRTKKPIPNAFARRLLSKPEYESLEGELVVGDPFDEEVFSVSTSGIMSRDGSPNFKWYVFDWFHRTAYFEDRIIEAHNIVAKLNDPRVEAIPFHLVRSDEELVALSDKYLAMGFEGLVLRHPRRQYKTGRSTAKEQGFMRFCPWLRSEAIILSIHEGEVNNNPSKVNELGYLRKSSHKDNKVGSGQAGSVYCRDIKTGVEFSMLVPTDKLQKYMWAHQDEFLGKIVKYKHKPAVIIGGRPRFPQFEGLRSPEDM